MGQLFSLYVLIYVLIGLLIIIGYLHVIFRGFVEFNITNKYKQLMYITILVMLWPVFVYYYIKNNYTKK